MKKLILLTAASCVIGVYAFAQAVNNPNSELAREHLSIEPDEVADTSASIGMKLPTQKGSSFLGCSILLAQLDGTEINTDNSMHYSAGISPRYGYFIANNFALGGDVMANIDGYTRVNQYIITAGAGIFARLYTGKAADKKGAVNKLRFFVEGGAGYGYLFDRVGDSAPGGSTDFGVLQAHLMPGLNYFANRNVAFELGLNYAYQHTVLNEDNMKDDHHSLVLSIGLQFFFCGR